MDGNMSDDDFVAPTPLQKQKKHLQTARRVRIRIDDNTKGNEAPPAEENEVYEGRKERREDGKNDCEYCSKKYKTAEILQKHVRKLHPQHLAPKPQPYTCCDCQKCFKTKQTLYKHRKQLHKVVKERDFACCICEGKYTSRRQLRRHVKKSHGNFSYKDLPTSKCVHSGCGKVFYHRTALIDHLFRDHGVQMNVQELQFISLDEFTSWKAKEEELSFTTFTKHRGQKVTSDGRRLIYFSCQRDGLGKAHKKRGEVFRKTSRRNEKGRIKCDTACTAMMKVVIGNGIVKVKYIHTHSHPVSEADVEHQPLPDSTWQSIKEMLLAGKPIEEIQNVLRDGFGELDNRTSTHVVCNTRRISRRKIVDYKRRLGFKARLHCEDSVSTSMLVAKLHQYNNDPVILYKPLGSDLLVGDEDMKRLPGFKEIFALGLQSQEQLDMLVKHGHKVLCMDATHGTNAYGYQLFNVMVKDQFNKGYCVANFICSHINESTLFYFFKAIHTRCPNLQLNIVMTDDDMSGYNATKAVFGQHIRCILCHWHVQQAWKRHLPNDENREPMYEHLIAILLEKRERIFLQLCEEFQTRFNHYSNFLAYFSREYMKRTEVWASAYRNFPHADTDTNMVCESYHNVIKTKYMKRVPNRRIDDLISMWLSIERDDYCRHYWDVRRHRQRFMKSVQSARQLRHNRGLSIPDDKVERLTESIWKVSDSGGAFYEIELLKPCKDEHCYDKCGNISCYKLCTHMYNCTCPDSVGLCKHIHKVHSMVFRGVSFAPYNENEDSDCETPETVRFITTQKQTHETNKEVEKSRKIQQLLSDFRDLGEIVSHEEVYELLFPAIQNSVRNFLTQANALRSNSEVVIETNIIGEPVHSYSSTEKIAVQVLPFKKKGKKGCRTKILRRPSNKRREEIYCELGITSDPLCTLQRRISTSTEEAVALEPSAAYIGSSSCDLKNPTREELLPRAINNAHGEGQPNLANPGTSTSVGLPFSSFSSCRDLKRTVLSFGKGNYTASKISLLDLRTLEYSVPNSEVQLLKSKDSEFRVGWLSDNIVDAYLWLLECRHDYVMTIPTRFVQLLERGRTVEGMWSYATAKQKGKVRWVFVPYNPDNSHWMLFAVNVQKKHMFFYDPLINTFDKKKLELFLSYLVRILNQEFPRDNSKYVVTYSEDHGRQDDMKSCGVYICQYALQFALGEEHPLRILEPSNAMRKNIYNTIVGNCEVADKGRWKRTKDRCLKCQGRDGEDWIGCDTCEQWFHLHCLGLTGSPDEYCGKFFRCP